MLLKSLALVTLKHGLGLVVRDELIKYINKPENMFTLLLDETTAKLVVK